MMGGQPAAGEKNFRKKKLILDFGVKNRQNDDGIKYVMMGGG